MFFLKVIINAVIIGAIIALFCYLVEKVGFSIYGFQWRLVDFSDPYAIATILILAVIFAFIF